MKRGQDRHHYHHHHHHHHSLYSKQYHKYFQRPNSLIEKRDLCYKRWKRFKTPEFLQQFISARRDVNKSIQTAKSEYYREKFTSAINSQSKWKEIRNIGIRKNDSSSSAEVDVNCLNEKFVGRKGFMDIKSDATGLDEINPKLIKMILPLLLPYWTFVFNTIFTESLFPTSWKRSKIIPLPKSNNEFRPISILSYLSKVFEKLMCNQIEEFLHNEKLLSQRQSGFRAKRSCITALIDVIEDI
ncbi:uncharacterized protein LOC142224508 [Haematobia irritans]|uniref:uncharacterized protein LOC142224508 n=1 Tax=Haematobia irritans TaxID=7368 RepID=UPI003F50C19C